MMWQLVPVDENGTPLSHGEPMTEVKPGVWMDPVAHAITEYLAQVPNAQTG